MGIETLRININFHREFCTYFSNFQYTFQIQLGLSKNRTFSLIHTTHHHVITRRRWRSSCSWPSHNSTASIVETSLCYTRCTWTTLMCISIGQEIRWNKTSNSIKFTHIETIFVHVTINEDDLPRLKGQFHLQLVRKEKMGREGRAT